MTLSGVALVSLKPVVRKASSDPSGITVPTNTVSTPPRRGNLNPKKVREAKELGIDLPNCAQRQKKNAALRHKNKVFVFRPETEEP
jgi:hypothetical protein